MNKKELLQILDEMDIRPGRKFGQNFMIDNNLLDFIAREADIESKDTVVEIGPGCGALTRKILATGATLIAVEIDKRIVDYLRNNLQKDNFNLVQGDACRIDILQAINKVAPNCKSWKCVANLPYSISSPFIAGILAVPCPPEEMLFLLQKETGQRLAAKVGTKNYGALSVRVQAVFNVKLIRTIPPNVFFPAPDVDSALVKFTRKEKFPNNKELDQLSKTVKVAFSQRRKKMIKALSGHYGKEKCLSVFEKLAINTKARAEELSVEKFMELTKELSRIC